MTPFLIGAGMLAVFGLIWWFVYQASKKRAAAFSELAGQLGYTFAAEDETIVGELGELHLFTLGYARRAYNLIQGKTEEETRVCVFDYQYTVGGGKHHSTLQMTVLRVDSPKLDLPLFALRPEGIFHKIGGAFGYQDIDFDSHPTFSSRYLLRGPDEDAIRNTFAPAVLDYFERRKGACGEGRGNTFVLYQQSKRDPGEIRAFIQEGIDLMRRFPSRGA